MNRIFAAAAAFTIAVPLAFAQPSPQSPPPTAPPAAQEPAVPAAPANPGATTPASPATPATSATPSANASTPDGAPRCRTRKQVGEQCSCLSAPTDFGVAAPAENGDHNMCVVPG